MIPQLVIVSGLVVLAAGVLVLLSFGPRFRVGRLLAATPEVSVEEAIALAERGRDAYVRVRGRLDSETEFEDAAHRPLVFRRTRIQVRRGRAWTTVEDGREVVPFHVGGGLATIDVDSDALGDGLIVMPRESVGTAADLPDRVPAGLTPTTPVRAIIEQISSVEHAIVLGRPERDPEGRPRLTGGGGRPLILTTLEPDEAMRVLTGGDRRRSFLAATLLGAGLILVVGGLGAGLIQAVT